MSDPKRGTGPGSEDAEATMVRSAKDFYGNTPVPEPKDESRADRIMGRRGDGPPTGSQNAVRSAGPVSQPAAPSGATPQRSQGTPAGAPARAADGPARGDAPLRGDRGAGSSQGSASGDRGASPRQSGIGSASGGLGRREAPTKQGGRPSFNAPAGAGAAGAAAGGSAARSAESAPRTGGVEAKGPGARTVPDNQTPARPGSGDNDASEKDSPRSGAGAKAAAAGGALGAAGGALASRLKGLRGAATGSGSGAATRTGQAAGAVPAPGSREDTAEPSGIARDSATTGSQAAVRKSGARRTRKARLRLAQIDPWSVMKTAFLFSVAAGIVLWVATGTVWAVIGSSGLFESLNSMIGSIIQTPGDDTPFRIQDYIDTNRVMGTAALIAVIDVVIFTALATLAAFLYNLASAMIGGLEVTLAED
ncbi:DUF3566 domain-containing protein [Mariniluteicoccus flavus]